MAVPVLVPGSNPGFFGYTLNMAGSAIPNQGPEDIDEPEPAFAASSIQARLVALRRAIPRNVWRRIPRDGAVNLDHYLYGARKKDADRVR